MSTATGPEVVPRRRSRRRRVLVVLAVLVVVPLFVGGVAAGRLMTNVSRLDGVFDGLPDRPPAGAAGALTTMLVLTDRGAPRSSDGQPSTADTLALVHLDADRLRAWVVTLPPTTLVDVPGHGRRAVSSAVALGGPRLAVQTVERVTGVHVDHVAALDWSAVATLVDVVGGVSVDVPATVRDPATGRTWAKGRTDLDGASALAYVRQDGGLPGGEVDRMVREQAVLGGVAQDALHQEMRHEPLVLYRFLDEVTQAVALDDTWTWPDLIRLLISLRDFRSARIAYLTPPLTVTRSGVGVELALAPEATGLWQAVQADAVGAWAAAHPASVTRPAEY